MTWTQKILFGGFWTLFAGLVWIAIWTFSRDRASNAQWVAECMADGKKRYECEAIFDRASKTQLIAECLADGKKRYECEAMFYRR